jgi:hypothetical protein
MEIGTAERCGGMKGRTAAVRRGKTGALFMRCILFIAIFFLWCMPCAPARADSYYPNSGVDVTDDAATVKKNHYQLLFETEWDEMVPPPSEGLSSFAVKYGLTDNLDMGILLPYTFITDPVQPLYGFSDLQLGFKYFWTPHREKGLLVSTVASMKAATADPVSGLGTGSCDYAAHMVFSLEGEKWKYHLNYGYTFWGELPGIPRASTPYYRFKVDYEPSEQWSLSSEVYGENSPNPDYFGAPLSSTVKATWQLNETLSLDFGVAFGLNPDAPVRRYLFSLTYEH